MVTEIPWWASDDPWAMSPDEEAAAVARRAEHDADFAALALTDPPF